MSLINDLIKDTKLEKEFKEQRLVKWFDNDYREYNEKLTRFQALGLTESVVDNFREKTYHNLTDLYREAEIVRQEIKDLRK